MEVKYMKTRLKHLSKSTISIILVLLMVISTVTVGIVATSAAYVDPNGKVGATPTIYFYNDSGSQTYTLGSEFTLNIPSNGYNGNDAWLYIKDDNGTQYGGGSVSVGNEYNVPKNSSTAFTLTNAKNYTNIKLKITKNNDTITVKWVSGSSGSSNFYIVGDSYLGLNWAVNNFVQMTNTSTNVYSWTSGDLAATGSTTYNFRVKDQRNWTAIIMAGMSIIPVLIMITLKPRIREVIII